MEPIFTQSNQIEFEFEFAVVYIHKNNELVALKVKAKF